jgi:acyl-coenzyme A thioesterase PaaI-like protein
MATREEISALMADEFPQMKVRVLEVGRKSCRVLHEVGPNELRPGGTVSGPVMMATADVALWVAVMGEIGLEPMSVTTSLSFNFMRRPAGDRNVIGDCRLMKVGRTLAVGEVWLYSEGIDEPVAHAVGTYALPPAAHRRQKPA